MKYGEWRPQTLKIEIFIRQLEEAIARREKRTTSENKNKNNAIYWEFYFYRRRIRCRISEITARLYTGQMRGGISHWKYMGLQLYFLTVISGSTDNFSQYFSRQLQLHWKSPDLLRWMNLSQQAACKGGATVCHFAMGTYVWWSCDHGSAMQCQARLGVPIRTWDFWPP